MRDFRELKVWQKAHRCTLEIYRHTQGFPRDLDSMQDELYRQIDARINEVKRMLNSFIRTLSCAKS